MALPLGNLYLHLDTTNIASNPTSGTTWFDLTANKKMDQQHLFQMI